MVIQTLKLLGNTWCDCPSYISRFMKCLFNKMPPIPRYCSVWNVDSVIQFLKTLFPLNTLSLKMLTLKTVNIGGISSSP